MSHCAYGMALPYTCTSVYILYHFLIQIVLLVCIELTGNPCEVSNGHFMVVLTTITISIGNGRPSRAHIDTSCTLHTLTHYYSQEEAVVLEP